MAIILVLVALVIFIIAYVTYGSWLAKEWGVDPTVTTPAHEMSDGIDYVPAQPAVLLGHHFASIAGAGPIVGPITAAVFGWIPVFLWVIIGSIFVGGVHDFGALFASVREKGRSIGFVIDKAVGSTEKKLFDIFSWLTLLLVVAAFANIIVTSFVTIPAVATTSLLFIILAVAFGLINTQTKLPLWMTTIVGVGLLFLCIIAGQKFPISAPREVWYLVVMAYIWVASIVPVWLLLQPRDYLNSYLLYAMIIFAVIGIVVYRPTIQLEGFTAFTPTKGNPLFPMLFITIACGAVSGFHSLVSSGTTSKQVNSEKDLKLVGYGAMLVEGLLAVISLISAAYLTQPEYLELMKGTPNNVFSTGLATFMATVGIPFDFGKTFVALAISAFALTSLDTATRIGRYIFQEFFIKSEDKMAAGAKPSIFTNMYMATTVTVIMGGLLGWTGYATVWPIFGSANQLLAAMALLAVAMWLKGRGRNHKMLIVPMIFMFAATLAALGLLIKNHASLLMSGEGGSVPLLVIAVALIILALVLISRSWKHLTSDAKADA